MVTHRLKIIQQLFLNFFEYLFKKQLNHPILKPRIKHKNSLYPSVHHADHAAPQCSIGIFRSTPLPVLWFHNTISTIFIGYSTAFHC